MMVKGNLRKSFSCSNVKTRLSRVKNFSSSSLIALSFSETEDNNVSHRSFCNQGDRYTVCFWAFVVDKSLVFSSICFCNIKKSILIPQCRPQYLDFIVLAYNLSVPRRWSIFDYYVPDYRLLPVIKIALFAQLKPKHRRQSIGVLQICCRSRLLLYKIH